jgi:hypothetical protein
MSFSTTSFPVQRLLIIASKTFPPLSLSSVSVFSSSSVFCAAFFAATLAADGNVDCLGDSGSSGCSSCGDSHLLLLLLLLPSFLASAAGATFATALITANRIGQLGDSGTSSLLLALLLASGNAATAILCRYSGCQLLCLWSDGCLFRLKVPILCGLL